MPDASGGGAPELVINMWSGPRNVSTALMYSWRQRSDTRVLDEPFYGIYLRDFDPGHPGRDEVIESMPLDYRETLDLITAPGPPVRYIKNIGHHLDALDPSVLDLFTNVLLLREPSRVVASLAATMGTDIDISITGLRQQIQILDHELAAGRRPLVFDSRQLLADPRRCLTAICDRLAIDFQEAMLSWPAGPKPEDGHWARYWYDSAHRSTGFAPYRTDPVPEEILAHPILEGCEAMYARLAEHLIDLD